MRKFKGYFHQGADHKKVANSPRPNSGDSGSSNSYVNAVKNHKSVDHDSPAIVLDEDCALSKDLSSSLMGRIKEFASLTNLKNALMNRHRDNVEELALGSRKFAKHLSNQSDGLIALAQNAKKIGQRSLCVKNKVNFLAIPETEDGEIDLITVFRRCWGNSTFDHLHSIFENAAYAPHDPDKRMLCVTDLAHLLSVERRGFDYGGTTMRREFKPIDRLLRKGTGTEVEAEERMEVLASLRNIDHIHSMDLAQKAKIKLGGENSFVMDFYLANHVVFRYLSEVRSLQEKVLTEFGIGRVVRSKNSNFNEGDIVVNAFLPIAEYSVIPSDFLRKIDPTANIALPNYINCFGNSLIPLSRGSFDVLVGMDRLSKRKFGIVCHGKVVRIPLEGDEILRVHGERTQGVVKTLMNTKVVEFRVDLVPGATPVAKSPYRLAPLEMQELSEQLQELQDEELELLRKEKLYAKVTSVRQ
ncbi:putative reverse transcriptase domain-containing protein [Tanacetum coccineum]